MAQIELRRSCWGGVLAIACALAVAGCSTTSANHRAAAGRAGASLRLSPDPAFAAARIAVVFGESGPDPMKCSFEWRRNGDVIDGVSTSELEPTHFAKGDRISVEVGETTKSGNVKQWTAEVRVANSPPRIASVGLGMIASSDASEVQAKVECLDPDGESPDFEYAWFRNGDRVNGAGGASLSMASFARGDRITVAVVAHDNESASPQAGSEPFVVGNHSPEFSSQPVAPRPGDTVYEYQAVARDPDGDPLRYELVQAPEGMTVGSQGDVRWDLPRNERRRGEYPVSIRAADSNGGEAKQEFTIRLGAPPAR